MEDMNIFRPFLLWMTITMLSVSSSTPRGETKAVANGGYRWLPGKRHDVSLDMHLGYNTKHCKFLEEKSAPATPRYNLKEKNDSVKVSINGTSPDALPNSSIAIDYKHPQGIRRYTRSSDREYGFQPPVPNLEQHKLALYPKPETDAGFKLGGFLIDILTATDHVDVHLVTKGLVVEGLDTVAHMLVSRFIQIEIWANLFKFLSHLGPTEGYLSADQFIVYGSSKDVLDIIVTRRQFMDVINTGITTWYYVVLDNIASNQYLADSLEEGSISILLRPSLFRAEDWVAYNLISPGDGSRYFQVIGKWSKTSGLRVSKPIFPAESTNFFGRHLIIGVINKPRVLEIRKVADGLGVEMIGYSKDIMEILQSTLNFTVEPREYSTWGHQLEDGTWDGVIGDLMRKEIDFSPMDFTPTKESREVIDFTHWVSEDPVVITSAAPQPKVRPWLLLEIFSPQLYVIMAFVVVISGVILWVFVHLNMILLPGVYPVPVRTKFFEVVPSAAKTVVAQVINDIPNEFSCRIFLIMVWYVALIVDMTYQGNITAFLAMPRFSQSIDNHEQLSTNQSIIPVTEQYSNTYKMIVESDRGSFQRLTARLETYDATFLDSEEFFLGVAVGKWAFVDSFSSTYGRALNFENRRTRCKFYVSRDIIIGGLDAWPFPRNSPVHSQISERIKWMRYYGILEKIKSNYYISTCDRSKAVDGPSKMTLLKLQGVFYVVAIGWTISVSGFILELLYFTTKQCFKK